MKSKVNTKKKETKLDFAIFYIIEPTLCNRKLIKLNVVGEFIDFISETQKLINKNIY